MRYASASAAAAAAAAAAAIIAAAIIAAAAFAGITLHLLLIRDCVACSPHLAAGQRRVLTRGVSRHDVCCGVSASRAGASEGGAYCGVKSVSENQLPNCRVLQELCVLQDGS